MFIEEKSVNRTRAEIIKLIIDHLKKNHKTYMEEMIEFKEEYNKLRNELEEKYKAEMAIYKENLKKNKNRTVKIPLQKPIKEKPNLPKPKARSKERNRNFK